MTAPAGSVRPRPTVFAVGWLSCDSVQIPPTGPGRDGTLGMLKRTIEESGMTVVRVEKPGQPGSASTCEDTDFDTELAGCRGLFSTLVRYPEVDAARVAGLGSSNGGGFASLVVGDQPAIGYVVVGAVDELGSNT